MTPFHSTSTNYGFQYGSNASYSTVDSSHSGSYTGGPYQHPTGYGGYGHAPLMQPIHNSSVPHDTRLNSQWKPSYASQYPTTGQYADGDSQAPVPPGYSVPSTEHRAAEGALQLSFRSS